MGTRQEIGIFFLILMILAFHFVEFSPLVRAYPVSRVVTRNTEALCPDYIRMRSATHCVLLGLAIPIHTARALDLQVIPGIGSVLAERIVAWRDQRGGIDSLEEMEEISGLGPRRLAVVRQYVSVQAPLGATP